MNSSFNGIIARYNYGLSKKLISKAQTDEKADDLEKAAEELERILKKD